MSKHFSTIVVCVIAIMQSMLSAQTPYDSFHPETSRPMLRLERETAWRQQIEDDNGSFLIVANHNSGIVMLYDLCGDSLVAVADINPNVLLWLSVDPLADKFIGTQPYLYCNGNPIMLNDPDGRNPVYDLEGNFLGVDDLGLQGEAIFMQPSQFSNGMDNADAVKQNLGQEKLSQQALAAYQDHYANLCKRPDWDGVVTASEGIAWARQHPEALQNPTADNMLYINAALLDFGNITTSNCKNGVGAVSAINLLNNDNLTNAFTNPALRNTVYALGRVDVRLIDASGHIQVVNNNATDYDWNKGGGFLRNSLIQIELLRTQLPQGSGFKTFYYGYGSLRTK